VFSTNFYKIQLSYFLLKRNPLFRGDFFLIENIINPHTLYTLPQSYSKKPIKALKHSLYITASAAAKSHGEKRTESPQPKDASLGVLRTVDGIPFLFSISK